MDKKIHLVMVVGKIAALFGLANLGYFYILPSLGIQLSYNLAPMAIAAYFLAWAVVSIVAFRDVFKKWHTKKSQIWIYAGLSLVFAALVWGLLNILNTLPILDGPVLAPYTDLLFATPWYFLPKSADILLQQILITVFILEFNAYFHSLKSVSIVYAVLFGSAHIILFSASGAPTPYAVLMTVGAVLTAFIFPFIILRIRGGFFLTYVIHLFLYILLAMAMHTWPPPGYVG